MRPCGRAKSTLTWMGAPRRLERAPNTLQGTAARLEELSRGIAGGFVASKAAMDRFTAALPFAVCDLGKLPIRGRVDGIDAVGLHMAASAQG